MSAAKTTTTIYKTHYCVKTEDPTERVFPYRANRKYQSKANPAGSGLSREERRQINKLLYADDEGID